MSYESSDVDIENMSDEMGNSGQYYESDSDDIKNEQSPEYDGDEQSSELSPNSQYSYEIVRKFEIPTKQSSSTSSSSQETDDEVGVQLIDDNQGYMKRANNKRQRVSKHNKNEHERRGIESLLFEELAQDDFEDNEDDDDDDDDDDVDDDDQSIVRRRKHRNSSGSESLDDNLDSNKIKSTGYPVVKEENDDESEDEDDSSSLVKYLKPDGTPWATEEEKNAFFENIIENADNEDSESEDNESSSSESEDDDECGNQEMSETIKAVLKFFDLDEPSDETSAEIDKIKSLFDDEQDELDDDAQEDARKTRILLQSIYSVSSILKKYPLEKALKLQQKAKKIEDESKRLREYLLSKGFPEDKLPPSTLNKK